MNLRQFFLNQNDGMFIEPFSIIHFILILITIIIMLLIYKKRDKINLKTSRIILAVILFFLPVLVNQVMQLANVWDENETCDFSNSVEVKMDKDSR